MEDISNPILFIEYKPDYSKEIKSGNDGNFRIIKDDVKKYNQNLIITLYPSETPDVVIVTHMVGTYRLLLKPQKNYLWIQKY